MNLSFYFLSGNAPMNHPHSVPFDPIECSICLETVRVPVGFECFPCERKPGKASCNSVRRACILCAREYLKLNKPPMKRPTEKKCLVCPATCNPRHLAQGDAAYRKDFMYMAIDKRSDYPCFYDDKGCAFTGTQNDLDRHMHGECEYRWTPCVCGALYRVYQAADHFRSCCMYQECPVCREWVLENELSEHRKLIHHQFVCPNVGCDHVGASEQHEACPYQLLSCEACHQPYPRKDAVRHWKDHVQLSQHDLRDSLQRLQSAQQAVVTLTRRLEASHRSLEYAMSRYEALEKS